MLELMINSEITKVVDAKADTMLLNYLREQKQMTGSKEGCASGDCGACTVVMVDLTPQQQLRYRQINACITPLHALHGKHIITVEHLKQPQGLHPVQQAVVEEHGTQCGFCTPGVVMSLYALSKQSPAPSHPADYLAGNLCRCTGYRPLITAAEKIAGSDIADPLDNDEQKVLAWLKTVQPIEDGHYLKPKTRQALAQAKRTLPNAKLIAGGTDLSLEITQQRHSIDEFIDISEVDDMLEITPTVSGWRIGAAMPMHQVHEFVREHFPSADEVIERLGSLTIRHRATLGGSLGHASPIGDIAPLLISLNGHIEVDDGENKTLYAPEDYITGYRETLLKPNQWISAIHLPRLAPNQHHAIYKVSKRYEDDIATVTLGINMTIGSDSRVKSCIISAGGVAAKSVRLRQLEEVFVGKPLNLPLVHAAQEQVPQVIHPLSDVRATAQYRVRLVQNLLQRFYLQTQQIETRLVHHA